MSAVGRLFGKLVSPLRRITSALTGEWHRMAPRERRLISVLVSVLGLFVVGLFGYLIMDSLSEIAQSNAESREALDAIAKHRDEYLEAKSRMVSQEVRIGTEPPQLAADLEAAAKDAGIQIPETVDRPPTPAGKRYLEHSLDVKLRKVDLKSLATFLNKVETGQRLITITRLQVRRAFGEDDKLDVELTATAFELIKDDKRKKGVPTTKGKG